MKAFLIRSWPILLLLAIGAVIILRATYVRNQAADSTCAPNQTLVVNYFAVPHFQSAIRCQAG